MEFCFSSVNSNIFSVFWVKFPQNLDTGNEKMSKEKKKKKTGTDRERGRGEKKRKGADEKYEHFFKSQNTA